MLFFPQYNLRPLKARSCCISMKNFWHFEMVEYNLSRYLWLFGNWRSHFRAWVCIRLNSFQVCTEPTFLMEEHKLYHDATQTLTAHNFYIFFRNRGSTVPKRNLLLGTLVHKCLPQPPGNNHVSMHTYYTIICRIFSMWLPRFQDTACDISCSCNAISHPSLAQRIQI